MSDPRVQRSREALLAAALDELAVVGYAAFSMESVAARAGVGRSTLYRHWSDRLRLIADALETLNTQPAPPERPGDEPARHQVESLLRHLAEALTESRLAACLPALVHAAEQDAGMREFVQGYSARRRQALVSAIARGVERGEFRPGDPDLSADALSGALFYRRLMTAHPFGPDDVPVLVDEVLDGPRSSGGEAKVVTLCGSTSFEAEFAEVNQRLTMEGYVVISVAMFSLPDLPGYDWAADGSDLKGRLGDLHLQKIRMADEVYVVDPGGYVGESTRREIAYAESLGKPVRYLSRERAA